MQINSAFSSGMYGLNQASQQMTESSLSIADQTTTNQIETQQVNPEGVNPHSYTSGPVTTELVNMKLAEVQAQAATKVITTADEMVGSLIDVTV
jgi:flagellar hook-associated protein FlgK